MTDLAADSAPAPDTVAAWLTTTPRGVVMRIPAERLYWAIIRPPAAAPAPAPGHGPVPSHGSSAHRRAWRYALEAELPAPVESLECRVVALGARPDAPLLACAAEPDSLRQWLADAERSDAADADEPGIRGRPVISAHPADVPPCLRDEVLAIRPDVPGGLLSGLEFRSGAFQHPAVARHRRHLAALVMATLAACSAAWITANAAAIQRAHRESVLAADQTRAAIESVLGPAQGAARTIDPAMRLVSELRTLRQTRDPASVAARGEDRTFTLVDLLRAWPDAVPTRVRSLGIDQGGITLRGEVREPQDYEAIAAALSSFQSGWTEPTGQVSRLREGYAFSMVMRRVAAGAQSSQRPSEAP